jgi:PAS domain S-box-containing protein
MSTAKLPIPIRGASPPAEHLPDEHRHTHSVQFYANDEFLLDEMCQFIGDAIERGGAGIAVATAEHREGLTQRLQDRGLDTATATAQGRLVLLDAAEMLSKFVLEGWPDPARFTEVVGSVIARAREAAKDSASTLVVFGEMVALLWAQGKFETAIRLEQLWNELRLTQDFSLRCAYPMTGFNREDHAQSFLKICSEHSQVIPGESYTALTTEEERLRNVSHLQQKAQALALETSERKRAQSALRLREAELADFLENASEGVQRTGADRRVLWANRAVLKMLGYQEWDYVGHDLADFFVDRAVFDQFWAPLTRREEIHDLQAELRRKNGDVAHVVINSNALWQDGTFVHTRTFIHDVTERRAMEEKIKEAHDELEARVRERTNELRKKNVQILRQAEILDMTNQGLRDLSARLLRVQEEERRRIARDLHDSTGQSLALLSMNLASLEAEAVKLSPELARGLTENAAIVRQISSELRTLSYLLHPPLLEEMGLETAVRWYIDGFGERSEIKVALRMPADLGRLSRDLEIAIFRVIQECLTNIHRHAESSTADIRVNRKSNDLIVEVRDEGKGIPAETLTKIRSSGDSGVGLRGMQERIKDFGGTLKISSGKKGTVIRVTVPVVNPSAEIPLRDNANPISD